MFKYLSKAILICVLMVGVSFAVPPKNVIILIGDGMGFEQVKAAGMYANGAAGTLSFESMPYQADCTTYAANSSVTDSAAAGTAIATGNKANLGVISMAIPGDGSERLTLLEYFKAKGKSTGLVSTTYISHATPAVFGAHEPDRNNNSSIVNDYLTQTRPNILMGGADTMTSSAAAAAGYTVVADRTSMQAIDTNTATYLSGQFGSSHLPYEYDGLGILPHLSEMTTTTLDILDNDPDGFFLMVEGGRIDHAGHANDLARNIGETIEFSNTVQVVLDWVSGRTDTLVIVTADHETGGLTVLANNGQGVLPTVSWSTTGHTGANVPVYAEGVNADQISGTIDNTDFFEVCVSPGAAIMTPTSGSTAYYGESVTLTGLAFGTPPYTYSWESDVDGLLGSGSSIIVSDLSVHKVGSAVEPHTITLTVEDGNSDVYTAQIELTVLFKADFEPDGDVDLEDYAVVAENWQAKSAMPTNTIGWWKLDESIGLTANDSSGNNLHGTLNNMDNSDWVPGKYGNALDFDGTDDYVQLARDSEIEIGDSTTGLLSVSLWFKSNLTSPPTSFTTLIGTGDGGWFIGNFGNTDDLRFAVWTLTASGGGYTEVLANNQVSVFDNEWHHVVAQFDSTNAVMTLTVDGVSSNLSIHKSYPEIRNIFDAPVLFGENHRERGRYWDGLIDDVRIYDYLAEEVFNVADFNKNGIVDINDLKEFVENWLENGI